MKVGEPRDIDEEGPLVQQQRQKEEKKRKRKGDMVVLRKPKRARQVRVVGISNPKAFNDMPVGSWTFVRS